MRTQASLIVVSLAFATLAACGDDLGDGPDFSSDEIGSEDADADADASAEDADADGSSESDTGTTDEAGMDETTDEGTDDATESETGEACEPSSFEYTPATHHPGVMLVLDKSGSMMAWWDHDSDANTADIRRWQSLHATVGYIMDNWASDLDFGALMFPAVGSELTHELGCIMADAPEVAVGPDNGQLILDTIPTPDAIFAGGTPARAAIELAADDLAGLEDPDAPRAIILVTDGAANCKPGTMGDELFDIADDGLADLVAQVHADGVTTYVIGIDIEDVEGTMPAINPYEQLTEVAIAGGAPQLGAEKFYNATNEPELAAALETVTDSIECSIALEQDAMYPDYVSVSVGGAEVPYVEDCEAEDGWTFPQDMAPYNTLTLCGSACTGELVSIELGCPE